MDMALDKLLELMNKGDELLQELVKAGSLEANALRKTAHFSRRLAAKTEETLEVMEQLQRLRQTLDNEVKSQPRPVDEESSEALRDLDNQITESILKLKTELELGREESNKIKAQLDGFYATAVESKFRVDQLQKEIKTVDLKIEYAERVVGRERGVVVVGSVRKVMVLGKLHQRKIWKGTVKAARDGVSTEMIDTIEAIANEIGILEEPAEVPETFRHDPAATDLYFSLKKKSRGERMD